MPDQLTLGGSKPPKPPSEGTARWRVLQLLLSQAWCCGADFADEVGWAWGSRLSELRTAGFRIEKRRCIDPQHHHKVPVWQYGIVDERDPDG